MIQHQSQSQVQLHGHHVTQFISNMQQRDDAMMQNFTTCKETVLDAAELYAEAKDQPKLEQLRAQLLALVQAEQQVKHHRAALAHVAAGYQPTLEQSDFEALIQDRVQQAAATTTFHAERDDSVKEFDEVAGLQDEAPEPELDDDEDLVMLGNVEKNDKCPYTRKDVSELDEPVEDQQGFVYEAAAIRAALAAAARDRMNWIECPCPGVSHRIMLHNLKPANRRRLQRLARARAAAAAKNAPGAIVLDV